jgi:hypothetical protein
MKDSKGFEQCYNAQIAVDADAQMIVATGVTQTPGDQPELLPMIDKVQAITGQRPGRVLADAGYRSEKNLRELQERGIDGYVAIGRDNEKPTKISEEKAATLQMARKLKTKRGRARYRERKWIAEPVFGWIKSCVGFRSFSLRGREKVTAEWCLVSLAMNLRRLNERMAWT